MHLFHYLFACGVFVFGLLVLLKYLAVILGTYCLGKPSLVNIIVYISTVLFFAICNCTGGVIPSYGFDLLFVFVSGERIGV